MTAVAVTVVTDGAPWLIASVVGISEAELAQLVVAPALQLPSEGDCTSALGCHHRPDTRIPPKLDGAQGPAQLIRIVAARFAVAQTELPCEIPTPTKEPAIRTNGACVACAAGKLHRLPEAAA